MKMHKALLSSDKQSWRTPPEILEVVEKVGPIMLDPCASRNPYYRFAGVNLWEDGLAANWLLGGLVYVNPPYGSALPKWVRKCIDEGLAGAEIILLVPARPGSKWWFEAWESMNAYCFYRGRITFVGAEAPAPFPSVFFYWGPRKFVFCAAFEPLGAVGSR